MKVFAKKPLIMGLLTSGLLLAGAGVAYANLQENGSSNTAQVVEREAQLPGGGFVRMETIRWGNGPGQFQVEQLTPEQARDLWNQSMEMQTALLEQMAQMQNLLSTAFFDPYRVMPPVVATAYESPFYGAPFWVQIATPQVYGVEIPQPTARMPAVTPQQHVSPQGGAPWPPHGTTAVRDVQPAGKDPKLPI